MINYDQINGIALAYIGDAVYEVCIRRHLLTLHITKPNRLHRLATHYVSAKSQSFIINKLINNNLLNSDELKYYKKGRNSKSHTSAKNTSILTYRKSTGFESLVGYLYLSNQIQRLHQLINLCISIIEEDINNV